MACFCRKRDICRRADGYFFKGFSTTRVKKFAERFRGDFVFSRNLVAFLTIDEEDRRFRANLLFLSKNFLRHNHPLGGFKP